MILVAIGSNLPGPFGPDPQAAGRRAAAALGALPGLRLLAISGWWRTRPLGSPAGTPDFVNGVARLTGAADPAELLRWLHAVEAAAGRRRSVANAARTLDLDLIDVGGLVRRAPDPVLPHPRVHQRRFVLLPLVEVAPGWRHPQLGSTAEELLRTLPAAGERPLR